MLTQNFSPLVLWLFCGIRSVIESATGVSETALFSGDLIALPHVEGYRGHPSLGSSLIFQRPTNALLRSQ